MKPRDLQRILSNVVGKEPQIFFSIYDPVDGEFVTGPWDSAELFDDRIVILVKSRTTSQIVISQLKELIGRILKVLDIFGPKPKGQVAVKGEPGFP